MAAVVLGNDLVAMPAENRARYVSVADKLAGGLLDYVRLEFEARRPGPGGP